MLLKKDHSQTLSSHSGKDESEVHLEEKLSLEASPEVPAVFSHEVEPIVEEEDHEETT